MEHIPHRIFVHQLDYMKKVLQCFNMDKENPLSTTIVVRLLDVTIDTFHPSEDYEEILNLEVPHLSKFGTFLYHTICTWPDISIIISLLARLALHLHEDIGEELSLYFFTLWNNWFGIVLS